MPLHGQNSWRRHTPVKRRVRLTLTPSLIISRAPIRERFQGVVALAAVRRTLIVTDL